MNTPESTLRKAQEAVAAMDEQRKYSDSMSGDFGFRAAAEPSIAFVRDHGEAILRALAAQAGDGEVGPKQSPLPTHADLWGAALRDCDCMWSRFPCWLIDHAEGSTLTEEMLQHELAAMLSTQPREQAGAGAWQAYQAGENDAVIGRAFRSVLRDPNVRWYETAVQPFIDRVANETGRLLREAAPCPRAEGEPKAPAYTTGHCENNKRPGGCQLHNLLCGWPNCDRRPAGGAK